jgi:hypothetical protein
VYMLDRIAMRNLRVSSEVDGIDVGENCENVFVMVL